MRYNATLLGVHAPEIRPNDFEHRLTHLSPLTHNLLPSLLYLYASCPISSSPSPFIIKGWQVHSFGVEEFRCEHAFLAGLHPIPTSRTEEWTKNMAEKLGYESGRDEL